MTDADTAARIARVRHDLANPLAAILAEAQLLLIDSHALTPEVRKAIRAIEEMALKMRAILREL